jgi:hypothetical protein
MKLFLSDSAQQSVGGGFRHPDVRTYDWRRSGSEFTLLVKFEGSGLAAEYVVQNPEVSVIEDSFSYD